MRKPKTSFLVNQNGTLCFRMMVPHDLRGLVQLTEIRYSLKTKDYLHAKAQALTIGVQLRRLFNDLRQGSDYLSRFTPQDLKRLIRKFVENELNKAEILRLHCIDLTSEDLADIKGSYGTDSFLAYKAYTHRKYGHMAEVARTLIDDNGLDLPADSEDFTRLCRELLRAKLFVSSVNLKREDGLYGSEREHDPLFFDTYLAQPPLLSVPLQAPVQVVQPIMENTPLVSEIFEEYIEETSNGKGWSPKTLQETKACLRAFLFFLEGDPQIGTITGHMIRDFKKALLRMPKGLTKSRKYKGMTLKEVLDTKPTNTLDPVTVNKYLRRLRSAFKWATNNKYIPVNVSEGVSVPEDKKKKSRKPFTDEELKAIFDTPEYRGERPFRYSYMFWAPLIALFTGMRNNEIAQLHLEDIDEIDGIPVIRVTDEVKPSNKTDTKRLKRHTNARRIVPIHPDLAHKIGFLEYVEGLKEKGQIRLFPELGKGRDGHGKAITRFFCGEKGKPGYLERCGVKRPGSKQEKVFHSFRNTILRKFKEMGVPEAMANQIVGHKTRSMSYETYSGGYPIEHLYKKGILKLNFIQVIASRIVFHYYQLKKVY